MIYSFYSPIFVFGGAYYSYPSQHILVPTGCHHLFGGAEYADCQRYYTSPRIPSPHSRSEGLARYAFQQSLLQPLAIARMADEAKAAARRIASALERTVFSESPSECEHLFGLGMIFTLLARIL